MTPEVLADCRQEMEDNMPDTAVIKKLASGDPDNIPGNSDGMGGTSGTIGGSTNGYVDGETYRCRVTVPTIVNRAAEIQDAEIYTSLTSVIIVLPWNAQVRLQDRIQVTNNETSEVKTYEVKSLLPHSQAISLHAMSEAVE